MRGPSGRTGFHERGFTVTQTRADRLRLDAETVVYEVLTWAWLDVEMVDPEGRRVLGDDFEVVVEIVGDDGPVQARFDDDALEGQRDLPNAVGIVGGLGDDGYARIGLSIETPQLVTVFVSPSDRSGVAEGTLKLLWEPGDDLSVRMTLPQDPFVGTVGEPFALDLQLVDQHGNTVEDRNQVIVLTNECGGFARSIVLDGAERVDVSLKAATGTTACPKDRLRALAGPPGESSEFSLLPGPVDRFQVVASPTAVVAGERTLNVFGTPVDRYGNRTHWPATDLSLSDSVGGIQDYGCVGLSIIHCTVRSVVAASEVFITLSDTSGVAGLSNGYAVGPGAPTGMQVQVDADVGPDVVAGSAVGVALRLEDAWGNTVDARPVPATAFAFTSDAEQPDCFPLPSTDELARFECSFYTAVSGTTVRASMVEQGIIAASGPFDVVNGPLASVSIAPSRVTVAAGEDLELTLVGADAWGNPYRVQSDPDLELHDLSGTLSPGAVTLGADGSRTVVARLLGAGLTEIEASQAGVGLGRSGTIEVTAAEPFEIILAGPPWAWVGEPATVSLVAVDVYGNHAALDAQALLSSDSGQVHDAPVTLVDGVGSAAVTWSAPVLGEQLTATTGALSGRSGIIPVVADCEGSGPIPDLRFAGFPEAITCFDPLAGEATLSGSFAGSQAGALPLSLYALTVDGGLSGLSTAGPSVLVPITQIGVHVVRGLVADQAGCGAEIGSRAWVGPDDGSPVGPIDLDTSAATLPVGTGSTVVRVDRLVDCSRDPAAGEQVHLRADRGTLQGMTSTGVGLALTLDGTGSADATLQASGFRTGGVASLRAWVPSGAATGSATVLIDGDNRRPRVWDQDPSGSTSGQVDAVTVWFSEALMPGTVTRDRFSVSGPSPTAVSSVSLSPAGDEVIVELVDPVDASAGQWTVVVSEHIRDLKANKLDGRFDGTTSSYTGTFGVAPPAVSPPHSCLASAVVFRPDGDAGAGVEADKTDVSFAADSEPVSWVISVLDAAQEIVRREHLAPLGTIDSWSWDGRDVSERVVSNGPYRIVVDAADGIGNRVSGCSVLVSVDNRAGE